MMIEKIQAAKIAHDLLKHLGIENTAPINLFTVMNYLGYSYQEFNNTPGTQDISGAVRYQEKIIWLNAADSLERKRFTLAHEIGHIVLGGKEDNYVDYRTQAFSDPKVREHEAVIDEFAGCLLMPEAIFTDTWHNYQGKLVSLAELFCVSSNAVFFRARQLQLLKPKEKV